MIALLVIKKFWAVKLLLQLKFLQLFQSQQIQTMQQRNPLGGSSDDAAPLPIPPPPGEGGDQQGSLDPASQKQSVDTITPAAGESQAAVAAQEGLAQPAIAPPAPGDIADNTASTRSLVPESETIADAPAVVPPKKTVEIVAKKKVEATKPKKVAAKNLGAKPVVLVAPQQKAKAKAKQAAGADESDTANADDSLYGGEGIVDAQVPQAAAPVEVPKKKKSLFGDVFKTNDAADFVVDAAPAVEAPAPVNVPKKPIVAETQVASGAGGFVVQLASFRSRAEAQTEYARLRSRHSGTLGRYSPVITEATVGGSTRYRLSVGSMASKSQADAVCSSLFAGGERDCLVKNR